MIKVSPYLILALNILKANLNLLHPPYKLTFALTYRCNGRCLTCDIWKSELKEELNTKEITHFFSKNNFFSWIDLTGGEITLREDICEIFRIIKKECKDLFLLHFPTNALKPEALMRLYECAEKLKFPKFIISISFDGPPDLYNKIRGVRDGWRNAIGTYKELRRRKSKRFGVYLGMTISRYNYNFIDETVDWLKNNVADFDISELHLNIAQDSQHFYGTTDNRDYGVIKSSIDKIKYFFSLKENKIDPVQYLERQYLRHIVKYADTRKIPLACEALRSSIFLSPQGDVYACCCDNFLIGNIKKPNANYDLRKLLSSEASIKTRMQIKNGNCAQCWTPCEAYQTILGNLF